MNPDKHSKARILVVDDDETIITLEKIILEKLGYEVTIYNNSVDALLFFKNNPEHFDMLITDQAMPEMTGEELIMKIISLRPGIPIILNSGYSADFTMEKARALGVSECIQKPINMEQLTQAIQRSFAKIPA